MSAHPDAPRIVQANDVAAIVIQQATEHTPGLFVTLDLRYGIADALWAAGYRKDSEVDRLTAQIQAARNYIEIHEHPDDWGVPCVYTEDLRLILSPVTPTENGEKRG